MSKAETYTNDGNMVFNKMHVHLQDGRIIIRLCWGYVRLVLRQANLLFSFDKSRARDLRENV